MILAVVLVLTGIKNIFPSQAWLNTPSDSKNQEESLFTIAPGTSGKTIAKNLEAEGFIDSAFKLYWQMRRESLGNKIKSGSFYISPSMTPQEILEEIVRGSTQALFTIPEGWTIEAIDARLVEWELIQPGEFEQCAKKCDFSGYAFLADAPSLEGYLFPDSFFIDSASFNVEEFIGELLDNFEEKVMTNETEALLEKNGRSLKDVIIMASIVEREALLDEDRPIIAGILWKRNENGWALEADATLLYITDDNIITKDDLELESPYNTRKYRGLPPTAISNPGLASIQAALEPVETDYWFYLHDSTGKAHYGKTLDEHNENKTEWL